MHLVTTRVAQLEVDRDSMFSLQWSLVMRKWLVNSILLLAVAGNAAMGMPLHSNEESCPMGETDCCKKAAMAESATPQVSAARLCCALNCSQEGTTPSKGNSTSSQPLSVSGHPASVEPPLTSPILLNGASQTHSPPIYSRPTYIRHLALLI